MPDEPIKLTPSSCDSPRILIVEDSIVSALLMEATINRKQPQFVVRIRKSLAGGIQEKSAFKPDLVILDLSLPDATEAHTLTALPRFLEGGSKVMVVSGHLEMEQSARSLGASDFMPKSIGENAQPFIERIIALMPKC